MSSRASLCALLALSVTLSGCLFHHKEKAAKGTAYIPQQIPVGVITLVNEEGKFALVDNGSYPSPPVGGVLKCYPGTSQTETGELVATNVRRRPFTVADIREGAPKKGDRVVYLPPELRRPAGTPKTVEHPAAAGAVVPDERRQ